MVSLRHDPLRARRAGRHAHPEPAGAHERHDQPDGARDHSGAGGGGRGSRRPGAGPDRHRAAPSARAPTSATWRRARPTSRCGAATSGRRCFLHEMPAVTIAAVNGACAGAGLGWACACDLRIAAALGQVQHRLPRRRRGRRHGRAVDAGHGWSGRPRPASSTSCPHKFDAAEALRIGLVTKVVPDEDLPDEVGRAGQPAGRRRAARAAGAEGQLRRRRAHGSRRLRRRRDRAPHRACSAPTTPVKPSPPSSSGGARSSRDAEMTTLPPPPPDRPRRRAARPVGRRPARGLRHRGRVQRSGRRPVRAGERRDAGRPPVPRGGGADRARTPPAAATWPAAAATAATW